MPLSLPRILRMAEERGIAMFLRAPFHDDWLHTSNWAKFEGRKISDGSWPKVGKCVFQVSMDVSQFKPSELAVKVVDNTVIIEGKFEEHNHEHGFQTTRFIHSYPLPYGYNAGNVMSTLSADGMLTVCVQKPPELIHTANQRIVPIKHIGPPTLTLSDKLLEKNDETRKEK